MIRGKISLLIFVNHFWLIKSHLLAVQYQEKFHNGSLVKISVGNFVIEDSNDKFGDTICANRCHSNQKAQCNAFVVVNGTCHLFQASPSIYTQLDDFRFVPFGSWKVWTHKHFNFRQFYVSKAIVDKMTTPFKVLIMRQVLKPSKEVFSSDDAFYRINDGPFGDLYSMLQNLEQFRGNEGLFYFHLCYPNVDTDCLRLVSQFSSFI